MKSKRNATFITIHPEGNINVGTKFRSNPSTNIRERTEISLKGCFLLAHVLALLLKRVFSINMQSKTQRNLSNLIILNI